MQRNTDIIPKVSPSQRGIWITPNGFLDPHESAPQTASWSIQPFLQSSQLWPIHRSYMRHLLQQATSMHQAHAMWTKNKNKKNTHTHGSTEKSDYWPLWVSVDMIYHKVPFLVPAYLVFMGKGPINSCKSSSSSSSSSSLQCFDAVGWAAGRASGL